MKKLLVAGLLSFSCVSLFAVECTDKQNEKYFSNSRYFNHVDTFNGKVVLDKDSIKFDDKSIKDYAVNGALYYATGMIASAKYHEVIAIGISGDCAETIKIQAYYVYGSGEHSFKLLDNVTTLDFLENNKTFDEFYKDAVLTEQEKHEILISSQAQLQRYAKSLNKLMHNLNITAPQRVLYVSCH